ncbi:MAG TPA: nucleotidyltransferase domain-containing protein [Thermoanaerobaculia bacterium]|nr:nucleotidyltransferase domain-containing protein [Thermoanaerobaculia bacterium]
MTQTAALESPTAEAADFLARWGLTFNDLALQVGPLADSETLLLVGSIAEGLANPLSDIDLMILGDGTLRQGVLINEAEFEQSVRRLDGGEELNVEYWRSDDVARIGDRLREVVTVIQDPARFVKLETFSEMELRFLHRMHTGIPLVNADNAERWRSQLGLGGLRDYLVLHWLTLHYTYREDTIAQVQYGDSLTALTTLRMAMDALAAAALATVGETHFHPKWRPRLLERQRDALGAEIVDPLVASLFPALASDAGRLAREALGFADGVIQMLIGRSMHLVPAMLELNKLISFVGTFEGGR